MKSRQRRLKAIELSLTPQQVVLVWLRDAVQAGTFEEGGRRSPPYRGAIANAVLRTVQTSMKGQPESLIEGAILQARLEADLLYSLIVNVNLRVIESRSQREYEYLFLLGYLSAEMHGKPTKDRVQLLRTMVLMFLENVIILDTAIGQIAVERLNGEPMLFRDSAIKLTEQLQMAETVSDHFNLLARAFDVAEINLEAFRGSLQSETDDQASGWIELAHLQALSAFGTEEQRRAALNKCYVLFRERAKGNDR